MTELIVPFLLCAAACCALYKKQDVYSLLLLGAQDGLRTLLSIVPALIVPLMLIRPMSGSAALAVGADLMRTYGPDSLVGRTAAVMLGSTETTFYAVSVYFGAAGVRKTRYTLPAALIADLTGFLAAAISTRLFF